MVQLLSYAWLFATPWTAAPQALLSFTESRSLLKWWPLNIHFYCRKWSSLTPLSFHCPPSLRMNVGCFLLLGNIYPVKRHQPGWALDISASPGQFASLETSRLAWLLTFPTCPPGDAVSLYLGSKPLRPGGPWLSEWRATPDY